MNVRYLNNHKMTRVSAKVAGTKPAVAHSTPHAPSETIWKFMSGLIFHAGPAAEDLGQGNVPDFVGVFTHGSI